MCQGRRESLAKGSSIEMSVSANPSSQAAAPDTGDSPSNADNPELRFTEAALERHKREGMELAVKARWIALAIIAVMLPFINPSLEVLYYEALLAGLALTAWAQRRIGRVGRSRPELFLMYCDLAIMTAAIVVPNPLSDSEWPQAMAFRYGGFKYFYVLLAGAALAYSWRTMFAMGATTTLLWFLSVFIVSTVSPENPS